MSPLSSVIASIAVLVVLMVSFGYMYISERKAYILVWFLSLSVLLLTYASRLIMLSAGREGILLLVLNHTSSIGGLWLILKGTCMFFDKKGNLLSGMTAVLIVLAYAVLLLLRQPIYPVLLLSCAYSASILAVTGTIYLSASTLKNAIKYISGFAFFAWSAAVLTYPFARILAFIPLEYGYVSIGVTGLIAIICIQAVYFFRVKEELQLNEEKIRKLAMHDKLTGVYNRSFFEELTNAFYDRFALPVALAMGDINGLKLINDTFGHKQGDDLLVTAVEIIKKTLGEKSIIVRWGGDEFIIIMPQTTLAEAEKIVENIRMNYKSFRSNTIPLDISIGLSIAESRDRRIDDILKQAEERMYSSKLNESRQTRRDIMSFLQKLLWEKDYQTEEHVLRLQGLAFRIGKRIGLSAKELDELVQVALLHDIGKITVPAAVLNKPEPLTPEEWEIMKKHSETGYRIAQSSREFAHISEAILGHHEWWNGEGYPQGLKGKEIPLYSRIVSIVDSFDVITHDRPYKRAMSKTDALNEIKKCAGKQYDPYLTEVFLEVMQEFQSEHASLSSVSDTGYPASMELDPAIES